MRQSCTPGGGVNGFDYGSFLCVLKPLFFNRLLGDSLLCLCDGDQGRVDDGGWIPYPSYFEYL